MKVQHTYTGLWITKDGFIRHELLPNGRYDEARGTKPNAYQGDYDIRENRIYYQDDTGFTADGTFVSNDELHHAGMVLFRRK
ncbi:Atu4866 domain-containing protein [Leclercia sp.]|uniref:Atu4866 domain-containing protein n=1 Tax=Leclercia sp. TaxID=1898428 RepID=UPI00289F22FE|nr:Atu4866 domain-containing protein [Leclercia sp.]